MTRTHYNRTQGKQNPKHDCELVNLNLTAIVFLPFRCSKRTIYCTKTYCRYSYEK